eukprot:m51a1_g6729 hypothetical protein (959) ;mRNA; r:189388-192781
MTTLLRQMFDACDATQRGMITAEEFRPMASELMGNETQTTEEQFQDMFKRLNPNPEGYVDFPNFAGGMASSIRQRAYEVFDKFDEDDDGVLNAPELSNALRELGAASDAEEVARSLLTRYDATTVGGLNHEAFERLFLRIASNTEPIERPATPGEGSTASTLVLTPSDPQPTPILGRRTGRRASLVSAPATPSSPMLKPRRASVPGYVLEHDESSVVAELEAKGLTEAEIADTREIFDALDTRRLGSLTTLELRAAFPEHDPELVLTLLDRNWSGEVEFSEFAIALAELRATGMVSGVALRGSKLLRLQTSPRSPQQERTSDEQEQQQQTALELQLRVEALEVALAKSREAQRDLERRLQDSAVQSRRLQSALQKESARSDDSARELSELKAQLQVERQGSEEMKKSYRRLEAEMVSTTEAIAVTPPIEDAQRAMSPRGDRPTLGQVRQVHELERKVEELQRELSAASVSLEAERCRARDQEKRLVSELEQMRKIVDETRRRERAKEMARQGLLSPGREKSKLMMAVDAEEMSLGDELSIVASEQITALGAQLEAARKRCADLEREAASLRSELERKADMDHVNSIEVKRVRMELEAANAELRKQVEDARAAKQALESELSDRARDIAERTAEVATLRAAVDAAAAKAAQQSERAEPSEKALLAQASAESNSLRESLDAANARADSAKAAAESNAARAAELEAQLAEARSAADAQRAREKQIVASHSERFVQLQKELGELREGAKSAAAERSQLEEELEAARAQLASISASSGAAMSPRGDSAERLEQLQKELSAVRSQSQVMHGLESDALQTVLAEERRRVRELQEELARQDRAGSGESKEKERLKEQLRQKAFDNDRLKKELTTVLAQWRTEHERAEELSRMSVQYGSSDESEHIALMGPKQSKQQASCWRRARPALVTAGVVALVVGVAVVCSVVTFYASRCHPSGSNSNSNSNG